MPKSIKTKRKTVGKTKVKRRTQSKKTTRVPKYISKHAKAYCRCLKAVEKTSQGRYNPYAICSRSVYGTRKLKGPGRSIKCTPRITVKKTKLKRKRKSIKIL